MRIATETTKCNAIFGVPSACIAFLFVQDEASREPNAKRGSRLTPRGIRFNFGIREGAEANYIIKTRLLRSSRLLRLKVGRLGVRLRSIRKRVTRFSRSSMLRCIRKRIATLTKTGRRGVGLRVSRCYDASESGSRRSRKRAAGASGYALLGVTERPKAVRNAHENGSPERRVTRFSVSRCTRKRPTTGRAAVDPAVRAGPGPFSFEDPRSIRLLFIVGKNGRAAGRTRAAAISKWEGALDAPCIYNGRK